MSKLNTTENDVLKMLLQGVDPSYRTNATLYVALYTAAIAETATAEVSEAAYTGYARVALTKATAWTDGGSSFSNASLIQFPVCTGGSATIVGFGIVTTASGTGQVLYYGSLSASLSVTVNIQPQFQPGALICTED